MRVVAVNPGATMSDRWVYLAKENARRKLGDPQVVETVPGVGYRVP